MALHIGFDPGGTGAKWAYLAAALDGDDRLFVGRLCDCAIHVPGFIPGSFPYLDAAAITSIETRVGAALTSLLEQIGPPLPPGVDPRAEASRRFGVVAVSVDAPSGFSVPGRGQRDTEENVAANFNTPDEQTFLTGAQTWIAAKNITPLNQRVYWKLVGFAIYRYFSAAATAAGVSAAASTGIGADFVLHLPQPAGTWIFESFPSHTYPNTGAPALQLAQVFAGRTLVNIPAATVSPATFTAFAARLQAVVQGTPGAWARSPGRKVGDCLDAFASMMLGPWAGSTGLRAWGADLARVQAEGVIVTP